MAARCFLLETVSLVGQPQNTTNEMTMISRHHQFEGKRIAGGIEKR